MGGSGWMDGLTGTSGVHVLNRPPVSSDRSFFMYLIYKQLDIRGVIVTAYKDRFTEGVAQLLQWIKEVSISFHLSLSVCLSLSLSLSHFDRVVAVSDILWH